MSNAIEQDYSIDRTGVMSATDLIAEHAANGGETATVTIYRDGVAQAQRADVLYVDGRAGIAWGADAQWTDADSVEDAIERYLGIDGKEMVN